MTHLRNHLRKLRRESGKTIQQIADHLGVHFTTICRHENEGFGNGVRPNSEQLRVYAKIYGVQPKEIYMEKK